MKSFQITRTIPIPEIQSTLVEGIHLPTQARFMHIENNDKENLFCLSFQTLPNSCNGVAHILEHTVLCGSEKFPVKDPFFAMSRRSLNTYMNALTGQDFTCYPASSEIEKDFYNLLEVYLDAVFHPRLTYGSFLQEGHRLSSLVSPEGKETLLRQGVVYNEMKGAMSGSDHRLWAALTKALVPDLPYSHNSGGDPVSIPSLSYEELIQFHRTFYAPSRCLFFFYGNLPLEKHLQFIEEKVLNQAEPLPPASPIPKQIRFLEPRKIESSYPISAAEDPTKQTILAYALLTASIENQEDLLALQLIDSLLTDTDASSLSHALLQSELCTQADSSLDLEMSEVPWVLVARGCEKKNIDKLIELIKKTLTEIANEGWDEEEIKASLHQLEFERLEIGGGGAPYGLTLFFRAALMRQHNIDPETSLSIHSLFSNLREKIKDPTYLTGILRYYLLENPHAVHLTLVPDATLEAQEKAQEEEALAQLQKHLPKTLLQEQQKELDVYQKFIQQQSLECLPKVSFSDALPQAKDYSLHRQGDLFHHACFTNRIAYIDAIFELPQIHHENLPLLSFLTRILNEVGSGGRSYEDTLHLQQATVGKLTSYLTAYVPTDSSRCLPTLTWRAEAFESKITDTFHLLRDACLSANLLDSPRIKELLLQQVTSLQAKLPHQALHYAIQSSIKSFSPASALKWKWQGLPYLWSILEWSEQNIDLSQSLQDLYALVTQERPYLVVSSESPASLLSPMHAFYQDLRSPDQRNSHPQTISLTSNHQGWILAAPVASTALAFAVPSQDFDSALAIAAHLCTNVILHTTVREKGGAYGSGASYTPTAHYFYLYSFRDPHIAQTYRAFEEALDKIAQGNFTNQELEEAKLCVLQHIDAPLAPSQRANAAFAWWYTERTYTKRNAFRAGVLGCSKEQIMEAVQKCLIDRKNSAVFSACANETLLKKEALQLPFDFPIQSALRTK